MTDIRIDRGSLNMTDAARYLGISPRTFIRWARDYLVLHVLDTDRQRTASVPFIAVAEAHVLRALKQAGVRPQRIRPALAELSKRFGREYVLAARELATDGVDVLWDFSRSDEGEGLIEGSSGQEVMREIVEEYLRYLVFADDGLPRMLRLVEFGSANVIIDPYRAFGQPIFADFRARVGDVAGMLKAGENPEVVADELDVPLDAVRTTLRVVVGSTT